ncbi:6-phosphogluconolactonase [bacterium]|nr:MAG: 6-phosphogluconolactonase [bacterium]
MNGRLTIFPSLKELLYGAAEKIVTCLEEELLARGAASLALSGGATPRGVYELLGSEQYRNRIDWRRVHLFWGDERCVGPTMPESNFRMANESLLRNISIPSQNIHRIRGELKPQEAARETEMDIRRFFGLKNGEFPRFTLVLLGLGEDGHTASLFPGTSVLKEKQRIVSEVHVESLAAFRVTLTVPAINNAATVVVLVSGRTKAGILQGVLEGTEVRYPAQQINPASGQLFWLVDKDAAPHLPKAATV